jgi:hypothetical protein
MRLRQFAGALNMQLAPVLYSTAICRCIKYMTCSHAIWYGNLPAQKLQPAGLLATQLAGAMLQYCARWWSNASTERQMAAQCLGFAFDGWQCECCAQCWQCNSLISCLMVARCLMLHPMAGAKLGYCANGLGEAWVLRPMVAQC